MSSFEQFGKYILLEKLAMGGMAEVFLAKSQGHSGVSKFIAIKRILPQFSDSQTYVDMFKDEARIAINLTHSNIVSIFDFGVEKETFFLAMDYIEGRNLRQILNKMKKQNIQFAPEQVAFIIKETAAGLNHAHKCIDNTTGKPLNIIHRDVSPQNVMISFEGEVKVVDFGIAKAASKMEMTKAGDLKGKFGYMSPEQVEGQEVDQRTDVFSLGIVLWELLANDRLFVAANEAATIRKIRDCEVPSLRKINPNISVELEKIVNKALAKDRNQRYQNASALHRDLSLFLNRQHPDFTPNDFSVYMRTLFAPEILETRKKITEYSKVDFSQTVSLPQMGGGAVNFQNPKQDGQPQLDDTTPTDDSVPNFGKNDLPKNMVSTNFKADEDVLASMPDFNMKTGQRRAQPKPLAASSSSGLTLDPNKGTPNGLPGAHPQTEPAPFAPTGTTPPGVHTNPLNHGHAPHPPPAAQQPTAGTRANAGTHSNIKAGYKPSPSSQNYTGANRPGNTLQGRNDSRTKLFVGIAAAVVATLSIAIYNQSFSGKSPRAVPADQALDGAANVDSQAQAANSQAPIDGVAEESSVSPTRVLNVSSVPTKAKIFVNGRDTGKETPADVNVSTTNDTEVKVQLPGLEQTQVVNASSPALISLRMVKVSVGYIEVKVVGAGEIFVDGKMVANSGPLQNYPVRADKDINVRVFDRSTQAADEITLRVKENDVKRITLIPRLSAESFNK